MIAQTRVLGRRRRHYLEWCLDDVKASELKEGKRKASPKCGFASYDRYAAVSRSGSRYTLATHHRSECTQNVFCKFIRSQPLSVVAPTANKMSFFSSFFFFSHIPDSRSRSRASRCKSSVSEVKNLCVVLLE